ncbi:MAG: hypothetical protein AAFR93_07625 [Pseudomonadota bacterium]
MSTAFQVTPLQSDGMEEDIDIILPTTTIPDAPVTPGGLDDKKIGELETLLSDAKTAADTISSLHNEWATAHTAWGMRYMDIFSKMSFIDQSAALTLTDKPGIEYEPFEIFSFNTQEMLIFSAISGAGTIGNELWSWRKDYVASKLKASSGRPGSTGSGGTQPRPGTRPRPRTWPGTGRPPAGGVTGGTGAPAGPGAPKKPPSLGGRLAKGVLKFGARATPFVSVGVALAVAHKNNELRKDYLSQAIPEFNNWTGVTVTQTNNLKNAVKLDPGYVVPEGEEEPLNMIGELRELAEAMNIFDPDDNQMFYLLRDRLETIAVDASEFLATLDIARRMICKGFMNTQIVDATRLDSTIVQDLRDDSTPEICAALG